MTTIDYPQLYIGGTWTAPAGHDTIGVHSPATEQRIGSVPRGTESDIDSAVAAARTAFDAPDGWSTWDPKERADVLERFAVELEARGAETARRVSMQNGMPIWLAQQFEAGFPPLLVRYYSDLMTSAPVEESRAGMLGGVSLVSKEPVGVVGAIVPWNVPQGIRSSNSHLRWPPAARLSSNRPRKPCSTRSSWPRPQPRQVYPTASSTLFPAVAKWAPTSSNIPGVDKVSFTGSTTAGRWIAEACGRLLRPVTLELGGKSAAVILDDVDLAASIESFFGCTLLNNGQICWLNTRVLVPRSRYTEIVDTITDLARSLKVGDPLDPETKVGPLVSQRQRERVEGYIAKGRSEGARMTTGGSRPFDRGWFLEPTIFADLDNNATVAREEIFGPVLSLIPYSDEREAIAIANDSVYGLGGSVWSSDPERATNVARRVRSGTVGVNHYVNDPVAPFGGIKQSGMGRELGPEGLHAFQVYKTIYLPPPSNASQ